MKNYIVYGLAIIGGLLFLVLFVVACHCYKKAGQIKRKKRLDRLESKHSVNIYSSEDYTGGHKNQAYDNESSSQTDSNDSTSKYDVEAKSETSSNRVFHFNLNNDKKDKKDKKESKPTDHVIVELDNNNTQMASSVDSGAPISLRSSPDILNMPVDDDESLSSNRFSNDQITVTDRSDSPNSDDSFPKRKQSMDDIYNDYYKKRLSHQQEMKDLEHHRRKSVDLDIVSSDYNPYMYYTTPNRGKNRHTKPIDQQLPQPMHPKHNYRQVKAGVKPRQRKHSEDVLRPQKKLADMRSNSLGDLSLVGVNNNYQRQSSSTLDLTTFGSSSHIANMHTGRKTSTTHLISPKDKGSRGIWASSNQRI